MQPLTAQQRSLVEQHMHFVTRRHGEEAYADGLLAMCQAARDYDPSRGASFKSFSYRRVWSAQFEHRRNGRRWWLRAGFVPIEREVESPRQSPDLRIDMDNAVSRLPVRMREAITLRATHKIADAARIMGVTTGSADQYAVRARRKLRAMLADYA